MEKKLFIHHHIFKNAGTSLEKGLKGVFGNAMYFHDSGNAGGVITNDMMKSFVKDKVEQTNACVSSHQSCLPVSNINGYEVVEFILLRNPINRFLSMYYYHQRVSPSRAKLDFLANKLSFKDFMRWLADNTKTVSSNFQTNFCSRTHVNKRSITNTDLLIAKNNLLNAEGVGIVEQYDDSIAVFNHILKTHNISGTLKQYKENQSKQKIDTMTFIKEQLGVELFERIRELNALDLDLYNFAKTLLNKKLELFNKS